MKKNGTGKPNFKVEQVTAISVSDTKQIKQPFTSKISSSTEKDSIESTKQPSSDGIGFHDHRGSRKTLSHTVDTAAATFLDVAVLRCLFITHWQEEGVYWALHYLYNR